MLQPPVPDDFLTSEQKKEIVNQLRDLTDEQVGEFLDILSRLGWQAASRWYFSFTPSGNKFLLHCAMPNNLHTLYATAKLVCTHPSQGPHEFCKHHQITRCPIDGSVLT
jgi:hypothetical protein